MAQKKKRPQPYLYKYKTLIRAGYLSLLFVCTFISVFALFVIQTKESAFDIALVKTNTIGSAPQIEKVDPFPIGVNPLAQSITEDPTVDAYLETHITSNTKNRTKVSWFEKHFIAKLAQFDWYQNLASPLSRILIVDSGERREEVVKNFADILRWTAEEQIMFTSLIAGSSPELAEGKFFPGRYVVNKDANPEDVAKLLNQEFTTNVSSRYTEKIEQLVPLEDALTIASLLEREAYDFEDMRYISGVIWNRLFIDMNLQLDASLQYAKANSSQESWWPTVRPQDKYIDSPFNTYQNAGLPPTPIANPSTEAILAALNPKSTPCIFYFHDKNGGFHCTETYQEHRDLLKKYYTIKE